jgi:predicted PurR-regulated permease PerM
MLFLVVLLALAVFIINPYLTPLLTSIVLAYIFYPIYKFLNQKIKRKSLSAAIVSILIIILVLIPVSFIILQVSKEANVSYLLFKQKFTSDNLLDFECKDESFFCNALNDLKSYFKRPTTRFYIEDGIKKITTSIAQSAVNFVVSLPKMIIDIFITFFMIFFLLRDGDSIVNGIKKVLPVREKYKKRIFNQLRDVTWALVYGIFVIAIMEGIIAGIAFKLFGVSAPILWGIAVIILAVLPMIGASIIWIPIMLIKFFNGDIVSAIGILIGGIIIGAIDIFIKPKVIGDRAQVHPILILLGVLGGLSFFGMVGIFIGPLILALLAPVLNIIKEMK